MGCFLKGCSRNYHCTCAVQSGKPRLIHKWFWNRVGSDRTDTQLLTDVFLCSSGCVLNQDNFTMRCPEHKVNTHEVLEGPAAAEPSSQRLIFQSTRTRSS